MEILLRVEGEDARHLADLRVQVEPSHTVADIAAAVATTLGVAPNEQIELSLAGSGPLVGQATVAEAGILSGQTLVVGRVWPQPENRSGGLMLVVASGPDAGRSIPLEPGRMVVGRDAGCDLVLTDPQVSRRHLRFLVDGADNAVVEPLVTDRNDVRSLGGTVTGPRSVTPGQVIRLGASSLVVRPRPPRRGSAVDAFGQVPFHRTPYFPAPVQASTVDPVADVPARPEKSRFAYLSALLPILMGVSFAVIFDSPRYLMFAAFSPVMVIGNWFEQRRRAGKQFTQSVKRFNEALEAKQVEVAEAIAEERRRRFTAGPDVAELADRAANRTAELWVRDRHARDFLTLRIGMGDLPTVLEVKYPTGGDAEFRDQVVEALGQTDIVSDVPVGLELASLGVIGLVGRGADTTNLASSLVVQSASLHSPEDLVILSAVAPGRAMIDWLKWVPHARSSSSPLAGPHLVDHKAAADAMIAELVDEAARRLGGSGGGGLGGNDPNIKFPWLLVLLDRVLEPDAALMSRLLDACPAAGISVVWLTDTVERVPRQAQAVVDCRSPATGELSTVSFTDPDTADLQLDLERVSPWLAGRVGRSLAPLRDASSANAATAIPRMVPLFTSFGIEAVDPDWVARQWKIDRGYSIQGPIGYTDSGPLMLDIVEHGPHGLIGGTSGAGKSELMMSMVAGLIAHNPPTRVNFLFIDYKGGASSDLFKDVPHTVGYVTNLDGMLSMRALTSLRAELNRRMNLLQGRAKDLADMIERHPDEAPPSLVIVVDEFATLVKEIPDFVTGIVDIAQRGRSLGIHLMLATQRPSGSVNDNIKANTNLRISLRMLDGAESNSVIGTPDAAAIPAPLKGRGFARMGPGDLVAFQSAWSGAPLLAESGPPPVRVEPFPPTPMPASAFATILPTEAAPKSQADSDEAPRSQIDALLEAVIGASAALGYERGRAPWLEVLPPVVPLEGLDRSHDDDLDPGARIVFGMIDDPGAQDQYPAELDLARSGGLIVSGTGGSGKSTLLRTLAVSAALDDSALGGGHLTIFALDFASRELGGLNRLPQCAGVATGDDMEAVTRIIGVLHDELQRRREALAEAVARAEAPPHPPAVLLLVDGLDAIVQSMEQGPGAAGLSDYYNKLNQVVADGRQVRIFPVIATARRSSVRASMSSAISARLTLRQAEAQGYADAGIGAAEAKDLDLAPGQGFLNGPTVVQIAVLAPPVEAGSVTGDELLGLERARLSELAGRLVGGAHPRLVTAPLPQVVDLLPSDRPLQPVIGLADLTGETFSLDLTHNNVSIMGDPRTGRSTALATVGRQAVAAGAELWLMAPPSSPLRELEGDATRACLAEGAERQTFVEELAELVDSFGADDGPRLLLLDDYDLLPENDRNLTVPLEKVLGAVRFVASGPKPRGFNSSPVAQLVRGCRSMLYLKPHDGRDAHEVLGVPVPWHPGLPMVPGRGLVMVDRVATMIQISDAFRT